MGKQFDKFKLQTKKAMGLKLSFKEEATILKTELVKLYKIKEITVTTKLEIGSHHSADEKKVRQLMVEYNKEKDEINLKYKKLDEEVILAGMKREIEILKNADPKQFTIPVNN